MVMNWYTKSYVMKFSATLLLIGIILIPLPVSAMITPILTENTSSAATDATGNRFQTLAPHGQASRGANDDTQSRMPVAGTISRLYARMGTALSPGTSYIITLRVNGASTALTCTITDAALGCSDTVNTVAVAVDDDVSVLIDPENTPTTQTQVQIAVQFEGSTAGESLLLSGTQQPSTSATVYGPVGYYTTSNATEDLRTVRFPTGGTVDRLYVELQNAPGSGKNRTITLRKNGADTGITCQVVDTATTCEETATSVSVAADDILSFSYTPSGTPAVSNVTASLRFVPTVDGESVMTTNSAGNASAIVNQYLGTGGNTPTGTEGLTNSIAPTAFTWKKLYFDVTTAPGSGNSRGIYGRLNAATTTLTTSVSDTNTTNSDTTNEVSVAAGDLINWVTEPISLPTAPTTFRISGVMYIPPAGGGEEEAQQSLKHRLLNFGIMLLQSGTLLFN